MSGLIKDAPLVSSHGLPERSGIGWAIELFPLFNQAFSRACVSRRAQVVAVLKGEKQSAVDVVIAVLTVVYRYRNNLFHGEKWIYDLPEQVEYFDVANQVLVQVLEIHKRSQ